MSKKSPNPLIRLWNVLGTLGGVITLSSLAESWVQSLVSWKGFIRTIVESYRGVIETIVDFLFGCLPFDVPYWIGDYLAFGILVVVAFIRSMSTWESEVRSVVWAEIDGHSSSEIPDEEYPQRPPPWALESLRFYAVAIPIFVAVSPLIIFSTLTLRMLPYYRAVRGMGRLFWLYLLSVVLLVLILFAIHSYRSG